MTTDRTETLPTATKVIKLQAANSDTKIHLGDQNVVQYGSNRKSEIRAAIGDNGQPFEKLYTDHINSL